jgi:peptidoglycan/LPS O-acetylase OafA/YrhL
MRPPGPSRLPSLTSLRFFAAAAVVVYHCGNLIPALSPLKLLLAHGYVAVTFFFVLSGFVLTWSHDRASTTGDFYRRRFARVWPLHLVTTAAAVVVVWSRGLPQDPVALALAVTLLQAWAPSLTSTFVYNGPSWSLSCEAFFYAVFPVLVVLVRRVPRRAPAVAVVALVMVASTAASVLLVPADPRWGVGFVLYVDPAFRLPEFVLGMLLAEAMRSGWRPRLSFSRALRSVGVAYLALMALTQVSIATGHGEPTYPVGDLVMAGPCALVVVTAAARDLAGVTGRLTAPRMIRWGERSFALYLVHMLIILAAAPLYADAGFWQGLLIAAALSGVALATAALLHRTVEQPWERRLRPARRGSPPVRPAAEHVEGARSAGD